MEISIDELVWHFDISFWFSSGGKYNLTPKEVIDNPAKFRNEYDRIQNSDTTHPLDIMLWKNKWQLLDGLHRLAKLHLQGNKVVKVRKIPHRYIPSILKKPLSDGASWVTPKAEIRESKISGKGLFAIENLFPGEVVVVWHGRYTDRKEAKRAKREGKLVMQWDVDLFSVEDRGDDEGYFINHSCDSNLWMEDAYTLIVRKTIKAGQEITADYVLWEADKDYVSKWECNCRMAKCRKRVTGVDWKSKGVQSMYKNHFSPLINKRLVQE